MNTTQPERSQPVITDLNRPFFDAAAAGRLQLQRCAACRHLRYPIASLCPKCLDRESTWETLSGRATVHSSIVFHQVYDAAWASEVPYNVAIVRLEEGPLLMTNVVGIAPSEVVVGMPVTALFTDIGTASIPQFTPASHG